VVSQLKRIGALGVCAVMLLSTPTWAEDKTDKEEATTVGGARITSQIMNQTVPVSARLVARQNGEVAARIDAPVSEVLIEVGDEVFAGQLLVKLDSARLQYQKELAQAEIERAQAALQTATAQLNIVTQELKRLQRLRKSAAFNQARFDDKKLEQIKAQSAVSEAEAAVRKAQAELDLKQLNLVYSEITAPYPGTVTARRIDSGDYVSEGQNVLTLLNTKNLEIEADVPADYIGGLKSGVDIGVTMRTGQTLQSQVRAVIPQENPLTRTRAVRFTLSNGFDTNQLASEQTVTVHIPQGKKREVTAVPKDAILHKGGGTAVFVVRDTKALLTPVTLGVPTGSYFEVLDGLTPGDIVVVRGNERLRPNQSVKAQLP